MVLQDMGKQKKGKRFLNPFTTFLFGTLLGTIARYLDMYSQVLGDVFSQMAIWILIGTLISIYSPTKKKAMINILPFCIGMLITYYVTAIITKGVYGREYIVGWTIFALCSPIMAFFAWLTKERGWFPKLISVGIVLVSILSSILLFDGIRIYDLIIDGILIYFLFFKKIERRDYKKLYNEK